LVLALPLGLSPARGQVAPPGPPPKAVQPQASGLSVIVIRDQRREKWRRVAVLRETWFYCSPDNGDLYAVPAGYVTDFASIPAAAKLLFPPFGDWAEAAIVHDWIYDVGAVGGRERADQVFKTAMAEMGVGKVRKTLMYWAVRAGGSGAYKDAGRRIDAEWSSHFVDRFGKARPPPFAQPTDPIWKRKFDCKKLEDQEEIWALQNEHLEQFPKTEW